MEGLHPINYRITLEPDLTRFIFTGSAEIAVEADSPVNKITLDVLELAIWSCKVDVDGTFVDCPFRIDPSEQTLRISLPQEMSREILLRIDYVGSINDKMAGFYRSQCTTEGKTTYIAVTQFEENHARRAFPCFDHPVKKATFNVDLVIPEHLVAISNGPIAEEERTNDGRKLLRFQQTPKMSTYLLFFAVGEFEFVEDRNDVLVRVVTTPGMTQYARFGLEFGRRSLEFCEEYYGIPYPLPKLDLIAIPDFAFGAMENWGAITFRENLLLHYPEFTSKADEQSICEVIAHEMAHQWFGDLVSPSDWQYLWLNESFATYFGYGIIHHDHPEWDVWGQFLQKYTHQAFERDALHETVPVELPGGQKVAINTSTAPIIYNKGGSILRQIEGYIGEDSFKAGLQKYLKHHEYGCAASHHLWEAFEAVSERPVTGMMKSWVEQPGFPMVEARRDGQSVTLSQRRFSYLAGEAQASHQQWLIPIAVRVFYENGESKSVTTLLEGESKSIDVGSGAVAFKVNEGQNGFYRVRYLDRDVLDELGKRVSNKDLPPEDRWGLQNDLYALVKRGDVPIGDYLRFLSNYDHEDAFLPLIGIASNLYQAFLVLADPKRNAVASVGKSLLERVLRDIGLEPRLDEEHPISILREQIVWHAVLYGSKDIESFALSKFDSLVGGEVIHPDLLKTVMQVGALHGHEETFDWFVRRLQSSESEQERMNVLVALGCFRDRTLIARIQQYILDEVPSRNKFVPITVMASNPHAVSYMWDWYVSHVAELEQFHPMHYERVIAGLVPVGGIGREEEVFTFFQHYMASKDVAKDTITLSLEKLRIYSRMSRL